MSVGAAVLGEDPDLGEISGSTEVIHFEHGGTRLGGRRLEF